MKVTVFGYVLLLRFLASFSFDWEDIQTLKTVFNYIIKIQILRYSSYFQLSSLILKWGQAGSGILMSYYPSESLTFHWLVEYERFIKPVAKE